MHAAPTAVHGPSAHRVIVDPLAELARHRRYNRPVAMALQTDHETRDVGQAIANCSQRLALEFALEGEHLGPAQLRGAALCNRRLCPFCEWRRTRAWRARLISGLEAFMEDHSGWSAVFLTLTVRNCQMHELRDAVRHLHQSYMRLTKVSGFPTDAWMRRTEVTVQMHPTEPFGPSRGAQAEKVPVVGGGSPRGLHPHLHCLLLVRPSYWSRDYKKQLWWQQQWQMAARLDYSPVIDVRRAKAKPGRESHGEIAPVSAVIEAAKYASKATDLLALGDALPVFHHEMRGLRSYGISKSLQRYVKAADPQGDDLLDTPTEGEAIEQPYLSAIAQWFDEAQEYRFVI